MNKLGFGFLRLPKPGDAFDWDALCQMTDCFLAGGGRYFDTCYTYLNGNSELGVKKCVAERYPRDQFLLAEKLPGYLCKKYEDAQDFFDQELARCGVEYFDVFMLHWLNGKNYQIAQACQQFRFLSEKKAEGRARRIGFSYHDNAELLDRVLIEHPEVEFVQLQLNYLDWDSEGVQSRKCYETAVKHGKPVIVMEPVKGGTLARVPESVEKMFREARPEMSIPSWAIRFAASLEHVMVVLSGMSNMEQLLDNTDYMADFQPLSAQEQALVKKAVDAINSTIAIPCTGCSYCTEGCPQRIAIPKYFSLYNADLQEIKEKSWRPQGEYYTRLTMNFGKASDCLECGQCEQVCPQHLPIIRHLKDVAARFEK